MAANLNSFATQSICLGSPANLRRTSAKLAKLTFPACTFTENAKPFQHGDIPHFTTCLARTRTREGVQGSELGAYGFQVRTHTGLRSHFCEVSRQ
jgi:hypothetical protein